MKIVMLYIVQVIVQDDSMLKKQVDALQKDKSKLETEIEDLGRRWSEVALCKPTTDTL